MAMRDWFITPKQKFYAAFLPVMTIIFFVLMMMSMGDGTPVLTKQYEEAQLEKEEAGEDLVGKFSLDSREVCMLKIEGLTLDQSWIWAKVLILDDKSRPVYDYSFNLSYYHGYEGGESWSEGDKDDYKVFTLPKGNYQVLVYAEDEKSKPGMRRRISSNGYSTIDRNEKIKVIVTKGVVLTRYHMALFIIFFLITCIYFYIRSERSGYETPGYDAYSAAYTPEPVYGGTQGGHDPNQPYDPTQPYDPNQNPPS